MVVLGGRADEIPIMTPQRWLAWAVIAAGAVGVGMALADSSSPLRAPLVLLFLAAAPAIAVAGLLRGLDTFARIFAACAATVVINVLVAETMLAAGAWSPDGGLVVVVVITALIGAVQLPPVRTRARRYAPKWHAAVRRLERL
jgi:hypothetical protein